MKLYKYLLGGILIAVICGFFYNVEKKDPVAQGISSAPRNASGQATVGLQKGNLAPEFTLGTLDGKEMRLSELRGKKVILNFWATWCPPCKTEVPEFERFYQEHHSENVEIFAVNLTAEEKSKDNVANFIKADGITYPVVLDEQRMVAGQYRISAIPTTYVIDTKGIIQQKFTGAMSYQMLKETLDTIN